jgi:methionyl-tRNA formyltransferase
LLTTLENIKNLTAEKQNNALATYANKISKEEAELDWQSSAEELSRKIRAFNPWPVAYFYLNDVPVRVLQAMVIKNQTGQAGEIVQVAKAGIDVATGSNVLRLQKIQFPGGRVLAIADVLNARREDFLVGKKL